MDAALEFDVERLLFMGSSCIYPKFAPQPIKEDSLMTGHLESTNDAYAVAKIAGITQVQAVRRQHHKQWISAMPTNLYGPGDNYSEKGSHVLPAMIRRYETARLAGVEEIVNWGSGQPLREFLYVDDLAKASLFLMENYDGASQVNVGVGEDLTIKELAEIVAEEVGYVGTTSWDTSKPDGTPRKLLDVSMINDLGWKATTTLRDGIRLAIADYRSRN
jgi:GDP-L-fucose synthase